MIYLNIVLHTVIELFIVDFFYREGDISYMCVIVLKIKYCSNHLVQKHFYLFVDIS